MENVSQYFMALDELNSHLNHFQFTYLIEALGPPSTEPTSPPPHYPKVDYEHEMAAYLPPGASITEHKSRRPKLGLMSSRPSLMLMSSQETEASSRSRRTLQKPLDRRTSSALVLRKGSSLSTSIFDNLHQAQLTYDQLPFLPIEFQGEILKVLGESQSCSKMPACKKLLGKYYLGGSANRLSRTSSTETLKADSISDNDNHLKPIAGKIANVPAYPFPSLKKTAPPPPHFTDHNKISQEVDKSIRKWEDYKDISSFFSQHKSMSNLGKIEKKPQPLIKPSNLKRPVTNPLYKEFDPAGYKKSDDELINECIQKICNDLNKWIDKLIKSKHPCHVKDEETKMKNETDYPPPLEEVGPDFLHRILRTELELPEKDELASLQLIRFD